jgi:hypothetical protein
MKIEKDQYSLSIDGKRKFIWSGAVHYYRMPSVEQWKKILRLMKDTGLNTVDVYYPWNYHCEEEGKYNFSGNRNVDRFMDLIEEEGLWLIARPGPYICSEVDAGGLPGWLIAKPEPILRCRKAGKVIYDEKYMAYVRQWWEQIVPKIARRKNLILFQIENEFNLSPQLRGPIGNFITIVRKYDANLLFRISNSDFFKWLNFKLIPGFSRQTADNSAHNPYIKKLYEWSRELGVTVPLFHNDILSSGDRQIDVDMMAIDDYPINDFFSDWRKKKNIFLQTDVVEEGHAAFRRDEPIFAAEFQSSWFDSWGGPGYDHVRDLLGADQLDIATKSVLAQRATIINYFQFAGGTTYGYLASPDVYTSCDMAAPIAESGLPTERWEAVRWLIGEVESLGEDFLTTDPDPSVTCRPSRIFCRARRSGTYCYVFVRNVGGSPARVKLSCCEQTIRLGAAEMRVAVVDSDGMIVREIGPFERNASTPPAAAALKKFKLPELEEWKMSWASPQLGHDFDDSGWMSLKGRERLDFDALGAHYGYGWYRGKFEGRLTRMKLDARHCLSVYINGKRITSRDNFRNFSGVGDDVPETFDIPIPREVRQDGTNVIVILAESLGHNKDFECDARNPRGVVSLKTAGAKIDWRFRGGLLEGERGLTPVLPKKCFSAYKDKKPVRLPHFWEPDEEGIGLYETTFFLDSKGFDPAPAGLVIPDAFSKANIYVNGWLMGRYWHEKGPQHKFYLPWGILNAKGENHLAIAVWKRWKAGGLGKVKLEFY